MTYRIRFDRTQISTSDLIRQILSTVEVRDLLIEDEPIEEIIKRIYAGEALLETQRMSPALESEPYFRDDRELPEGYLGDPLV